MQQHMLRVLLGLLVGMLGLKLLRLLRWWCMGVGRSTMLCRWQCRQRRRQVRAKLMLGRLQGMQLVRQ